MSTQFPVYRDTQLEIELDERSCKFEILVSLTNEPNGEQDRCYSTKKLTESEIIDVAVSILGPLFYYSPDSGILDEFVKRLKEKGYISP